MALRKNHNFLPLDITIPSSSNPFVLYLFSINIIDEQARNILLLFLFYVKMNIDTRMKKMMK